MYTLIEIALSVGVLLTLVTTFAVCVCGCKNSNQKNELVGLAGVVKIHFDEAPSPTPTTPASIKRVSTQNSQRSLPEIPHPVGRHDSGDTASEIYATVNLDTIGIKPVVTASTSRDHPYEHAYAKLQNDSHNITVEITPDQVSNNDMQIDERDVTQNGAESVVISASVAISGQLPSSQELPYITPPSPRATQTHYSGDSTDSTKGYTSISVREPLSNIRAQSMKPPTQPHYATVSDDSDEMYAAIEEASAGEGSDTYAQIAPEPRRAPAAPPVSDAPLARRSAPPEVGASTSQATHSRQASSSSCTNSTSALNSPKPEKRQANSPLPPPPHTQQSAQQLQQTQQAHSHIQQCHSHAQNHAQHSHGQQSAHSSRAAADTQQRHQRISSTGDLHFNHDKLRRSLNEKHQRNNSCVSSSDFYGCNYPVEKHRFSSGDIVRPLVAREMNFSIDQQDGDNLYNSIDGPQTSQGNGPVSEETRVTDSPPKNLEEMYAKVIKKAKGRSDENKGRDSTGELLLHTSKFRADDPGYETIDRKKSINHGYETIAHKQRSSHNQDPGYETVKDINKSSPNTSFSNNNLKVNHDSGPNSIVSSDPGYEHIAKTDNNASDSDPNYEVLRNQPPYATVIAGHTAYSTVHKRPSKFGSWPPNNNEEPAQEPNYESMPHEAPYNTGSESDPNYESVRPKDPNYETFGQDPNYESLRCKDPKYESVRSKDPKYDSVRSKKDPNYESVKYFDLTQDPPYEKVDKEETTSAGVERSDSSAGYERINVSNNGDTKSSINSGTDGNVSDYFQV